MRAPGGAFCFVEKRDGAEIRHAGVYLEILRLLVLSSASRGGM